MPADDTIRTFPFDFAEGQQLVGHPLALILLTPFAVIFLWAAWLEIRRWWLYGPSRNNRADFPINENAPSYEQPSPESETSGAAGPRRK